MNMWPFGKRKTEKIDEPRHERPVFAPRDGDTICTMCLARYSRGTLPCRHPVCPACDSEGMGIETESTRAYLDSNDLAYFEGMLSWWDAKEASFVPYYFALKRQRILDLITLKRRA